MLGSVLILGFTQCSKEGATSTDTKAFAASLTSDLSSASASIDTRSQQPAAVASNNGNGGYLYNCISLFPAEPLSESEINTLNIMREEELLAQDVYLSMASLYTVPIFANIAQSESQHTIAIKALMTKYNLTDIAAGHTLGIFVNPDIQALYNTLVQQGSVSLNAGLIVGATIEDMDIADLEEHIASDVDNADILYVLNELEKGSRNHLRSFYSLLVKRGITYTPQYISPEYFAEIIESPHETGSSCPF
jgi:hypothetical protein